MNKYNFHLTAPSQDINWRTNNKTGQTPKEKKNPKWFKPYNNKIPPQDGAELYVYRLPGVNGHGLYMRIDGEEGFHKLYLSMQIGQALTDLAAQGGGLHEVWPGMFPQVHWRLTHKQTNASQVNGRKSQQN